MELGDPALPVTRGQLDIWLAQETGDTGTEWQLGLFVKIDGAVERDALEWAIRRVVGEAEPVRAAFFEVNGRLYQRPLDYQDVELATFDLSQVGQPMREARELASSIQRAAMPFTGQLFRFALFQAGADEAYLFVCCHHIVIDGYGQQLRDRRVFFLEADGRARHADLCQSRAHRILSCDEARAARRAALLRVIVGKRHALFRHTIDIRRPVAHHALAKMADVPHPDVVAPENQDIRFFCRHG